MIINVASRGGRTHMLSLARELEKQGNQVRFYSYVKSERAIQFGLKKECNYTLYYFAFPFLVLFKVFGFKRWTEFLYQRWCDWFMSLYMAPCDVFIGESPIYCNALRVAKMRFNAKTILESGTLHVKEFDTRYRLIGKKEHSQLEVKYYEKSYKIADYISVGSAQAKESFIKHGINPEKIFVNNYGFEVEQFHPTVLDDDHVDMIYVGNWGIMKGCQLIEELCEQQPDLTFLHVGNLVNPFPTLSNMKHVDSVQQQDLISYYKKARIFILPSYLEGLAMVQLQAMACGLPIVCSKFTGGIDLIKYCKSKEWILEMDSMDAQSLKEKVESALYISRQQIGVRTYLKENFKDASWDGYGERYHNFLSRDV